MFTHIHTIKVLQSKYRLSKVVLTQDYDIPTMDTGCEVAKRAFYELTDIQVNK